MCLLSFTQRLTWVFLETSLFGYSTGFKRQLEDETAVICAYKGWVGTLQIVFRRASQVEMCAQAVVDLCGTLCPLQTVVI
jgi:hypothetical protein